MKRATRPRDPSVLIITAAGFAATVAQILLLRELLVLFYGNEMSTALVLAGWLLWTALGSAASARLARRFEGSEEGHEPREHSLALLLALQALGIPLLVLAVRGARAIVGIPLGELAPLGTMLVVCVAAPVLFAPVAGALFGWCWAYRWSRSTASGSRPLAIYLGEALGAAAGGIAFYFLLLRWTTAWTAAVLVAIALTAVSMWVAWGARSAGARGASGWRIAAIGSTVVVVLGLAVVGGEVRERSRRWQWGEDLAAVRDTPFHNIAVLEQQGQVTVFANGLWLLTEPDPASAEMAVHPALLQHPEPRRILLLGGGLAGQIEEVLAHPDIERVDYVEQDPGLVAFVGEFLDREARRSLADARVRLVREDAGTYLRRSRERYDAILMSVGDPINAQMNRFYTVELFRRVEQSLRPGGLFTFSVPGGGDLIGPSHARLLGSLERTLREVFAAVRVLPGERARFFAARETSALELDAAVLAARIVERQLDLVHVRWDTLEDWMSPARIDYVEAVLEELGESPVNRQLDPVCYYYGLMLWAAQWHPELVRWLERGAAIRASHLFLAVGAIGLGVALFFWLGRPRYRAAVGASVLVQGVSGMVLQVVLILTFQILAGFAYLQLALIISLFMAGLAVGALGVGQRHRRWRREAPAVPWLAGMQAVVTILPLAFLALVSLPGEGLRDGLSLPALSALFSSVSFVAGLLAGGHFSLAVLAATAAGARLERTGGYLYALDLAGAAAGALLAGLFLLPLYGVAATLVMLSLSSLACLLALLRRP